MLLAAGAALIAALPAFVAIQLPPGRAAAAVPLLMAAYGLLQMYYGLVYSSIQDIVAPGLRGTAMAAYFVVTYLGGASWGPLITGRLSDHFAWEAARASESAVVTEASRAIGLHQAMYAIPAVSVVLAGILWMGRGLCVSGWDPSRRVENGAPEVRENGISAETPASLCRHHGIPDSRFCRRRAAPGCRLHPGHGPLPRAGRPLGRPRHRREIRPHPGVARYPPRHALRRRGRGRRPTRRAGRGSRVDGRHPIPSTGCRARLPRQISGAPILPGRRAARASVLPRQAD